jgi:hypothetical protein
MHRSITAFIGLLLCFGFSGASAQDATQTFPAGYLAKLTSRISSLENKLDRHTEKALSAFKKQEEKIRRKLGRLDSAKARQIFASTQDKYRSLRQRLDQPGNFTGYIPHLDTIKTALKFLDQGKQLLPGTSGQQLSAALSRVNELQGQLQKAETIKAFIRERKDELKRQLEGLGFATQLKKLNKQAYYYAAQVKEYKELLKDPSKIERKALEILTKTAAFKDFMRKNSQLASLFRIPGEPVDPASLQGLQTRAQVSALIQERIGAGGPNAEALVRENIQAAQAQLSALKNKAAALGQGSVGSAGEGDLPDFKPNSQKTKSFLQRLQLGTDLQTQKGQRYFPITSDIGVSVGYKLNDKSIVGLGASYKLGLGTGWNNITISHQGVGFRSFVDYQLKGSLLISGGYEQNYRSAFHSIDQLKDYSAWQTSGLLGLSKKYKVSKKLKGEVKLLWDFLSYRQIPRTQAVLFRVGYSLK